MNRVHSKSEEHQDVARTENLDERDVASLRNHAHLLQIFHHRNKNQHRRSPWWRHFDHFRRELKACVFEIEGSKAADTSKKPDVLLSKKSRAGKDAKSSIAERMQTLKAERQRNEARKARCTIRLQSRINLWSEHLVAEWYHSFGQLTADPQFAVLGIFLIAVLGKVCGILGVKFVRDTNEDRDTRSLDVPASASMLRPVEQIFPDQDSIDEPGLDVGVKIERPLDDDEVSDGSLDQPVGKGATPLVLPPASTEKLFNTQPVLTKKSKDLRGQGKGSTPAKELKRKDTSTKNKGPAKKVKKTGNSIDDLFSGMF